MKSRSKVAIITGAGSGIGRDFALSMLRKGWSLTLTGRSLDKLNDTATRAGDLRSHCRIFPADISNPDNVKALFDFHEAHFERLDLLFNNAGTNIPALEMDDVSYDQWRVVIDTNLTGTFLCTQQAFRMMKRQEPQGGRIINNGSLSAQVPRPLSAPYTASKHAVSGLTKSTNLDGKRYNIICSQIDIGNAATPMAEKMNTGVLQADGSIQTEPTMELKHVTKALVYIAELPLDINVLFMDLMASQMPFVGRG